MPDRLRLNFHLPEKLMVSLLEPHHVGRISASGNCCSRSIFYRVSSHKQAKEVCVPGIFVVRAVASLTRYPTPFTMFFFVAVTSKRFGLISLGKKEQSSSSSGNVTWLCVSFAQFIIKEVMRCWGVTESVRLVKQVKVNFQSDTCLVCRLIGWGAADLEILPVQYFV